MVVRNCIYCIQHSCNVDTAVVIDRNRLFSTVGVTAPEIVKYSYTHTDSFVAIADERRFVTITICTHVICTAQLGLLIL